jgi:hypothetical protein
MNENFILTVDNKFTNEDCERLIKMYNVNTVENNLLNYNFKDIDVNSFMYLNKFKEILEAYKTKYEEIDMTSSFWAINALRFKFFKKGNSLSEWHSEHNFTYHNRVLAIQLYLTEHNCGTEFYYNKKTILSKVGRVCMFPAYFSHTHRGQPDFNNDRMIITGYVEFVQKGNREK